jgi:biopolymer transport protein ExbB
MQSTEARTLFGMIIQAWPALVPLAVCSVLVIAVTLERMWAFARLKPLSAALLHRTADLLKVGKVVAAREEFNAEDSPYARLATASLDREQADEQEVSDMLALAADKEMADAGGPVWILGTIGNLAPFIGLFGTVIGIIKSFEEVRRAGTAGYGVVAGGISEALIATAAGLAVAIIAVVANNACTTWLERYRLSLERFATEWSFVLDDVRAGK